MERIIVSALIMLIDHAILRLKLPIEISAATPAGITTATGILTTTAISITTGTQAANTAVNVGTGISIGIGTSNGAGRSTQTGISIMAGTALAGTQTGISITMIAAADTALKVSLGATSLGATTITGALTQSGGAVSLGTTSLTTTLAGDTPLTATGSSTYTNLLVLKTSLGGTPFAVSITGAITSGTIPLPSVLSGYLVPLQQDLVRLHLLVLVILQVLWQLPFPRHNSQEPAR